jgi:hypothetical protein
MDSDLLFCLQASQRVINEQVEAQCRAEAEKCYQDLKSAREYHAQLLRDIAQTQQRLSEFARAAQDMNENRETLSRLALSDVYSSTPFSDGRTFPVFILTGVVAASMSQEDSAKFSTVMKSLSACDIKSLDVIAGQNDAVVLSRIQSWRPLLILVFVTRELEKSLENPNFQAFFEHLISKYGESNFIFVVTTRVIGTAIGRLEFPKDARRIDAAQRDGELGRLRDIITTHRRFTAVDRVLRVMRSHHEDQLRALCANSARIAIADISQVVSPMRSDLSKFLREELAVDTPDVSGDGLLLVQAYMNILHVSRTVGEAKRAMTEEEFDTVCDAFTQYALSLCETRSERDEESGALRSSFRAAASSMESLTAVFDQYIHQRKERRSQELLRASARTQSSLADSVMDVHQRRIDGGKRMADAIYKLSISNPCLESDIAQDKQSKAEAERALEDAFKALNRVEGYFSPLFIRLGRVRADDPGELLRF